MILILIANLELRGHRVAVLLECYVHSCVFPHTRDIANEKQKEIKVKLLPPLKN